MKSQTPIAALIVAGGTGVRMNAALPKQYLRLGNALVLRRTIEAFLHHPAIDTVMVVIHPDHRQWYEASVAGLSLPEPVYGGDTRQDSVYAGLKALEKQAPGSVLIHDAARPLVSATLIHRVAIALEEHAAVVPGVPVADTLRYARPSAMGRAQDTIDRDGLVHIQTPQGFRYEEILRAHVQVGGRALTDDAAVAMAAGLPIHTTAGERANMKLTTPEDMALAEAIIGQRQTVRIGMGFDVHRFADAADDGRPVGEGQGATVRLCGIDVPHDRRLLGHSDADVGLHALVDAILGALAAGDIGSHFPPSDAQWAGADSGIFVEHCRVLLEEKGAELINADLTIICEAPKVGPHRDAMRERIAAVLRCDTSRISVKATTTEQLGFTGRGEGIAAQAVVGVRILA